MSGTDPDTPAPQPPDPAPLRRLDPGAVRLWRLALALRGGVLLVAVAALELVVASPLPAGLALAGLALATGLTLAFLPPLQYRRWRFGLRRDHLYLRRGVLFRTTSIVPYARIQHVDTQHGPIDRWLGLASLVVYTAGTRGAILTIPALEAREAEAVRDRLAALSGTGDAV